MRNDDKTHERRVKSSLKRSGDAIKEMRSNDGLPDRQEFFFDEALSSLYSSAVSINLIDDAKTKDRLVVSGKRRLKSLAEKIDKYATSDRSKRRFQDIVNSTDNRYEIAAGHLMKSMESQNEHWMIGMVAAIGLIVGTFFLSSNITGNVIGLSQSTGNIIGSVLIAVGLVGCFSWFRARRRKI